MSDKTLPELVESIVFVVYGMCVELWEYVQEERKK